MRKGGERVTKKKRIMISLRDDEIDFIDKTVEWYNKSVGEDQRVTRSKVISLALMTLYVEAQRKYKPEE